MNPYIQFYHPRAVLGLIVAHGKRRAVHQRWARRFELFRELRDRDSYLRTGITLAELKRSPNGSLRLT
jgi:hypothetical protein